MAILGLPAIKHTGKSASGDTTRQEYTTVYIVYSDSASDDSIDVETATGIPTYGSHYQVSGSYDLRAYLKGRSSKEVGATPDGRHVCEVTCNFSTDIGDPEKSDPTKDPAEFPLDIEVDGEEYLDYPQKDLDGYYYENKAGEPYDSSKLGTPKNYAIVTFTKYQETNPLSTALEYQNTVNLDYFYDAEPGTLKCAKIRGRLEYKNGYERWKTTYVFHYKTPNALGAVYTWYKVLLNAGEYYLDVNGNKVYDAPDGHKKSSPTKLKIDGTKLGDDDDPVYLYFRQFGNKNFFNLNL